MKNRAALYFTIIIFNLLVGSFLNYLADDFNVLSVLFRSSAIILLPVIVVSIIAGSYRLIKKDRLSSSSFDKAVVICWLLGLSLELITYFLL